MSFAWPWLFLALPLPWLLRMRLAPVAAGAALRVPRLPEVATTVRLRQTLQLLLATLAWLLLVTAAARPQLPDAMPHAIRSRDLMIAFDVSMSMATADLRHDSKQIERLQAARILADAFLARRTGDRVGLVVFGTKAYLHTPKTFDLHAVRAALDGVQAGLAGRETALGDAIGLSVKYLTGLSENARVLVLLTDGANTAGALTPERAAWLAQRNGVVIHAAAIGAPADQDEAALKDISAQTGGSYTRATDGAALAAFFDSLDRIEPSLREGIARPMRELYAWPLALACLLAAALAWRGRNKVRA